jgi:hypothetical protein
MGRSRRARHSLAHALDPATMHDATGHERTHHGAALQGKKHKVRAMEQWNSQRQHIRSRGTNVPPRPRDHSGKCSNAAPSPERIKALAARNGIAP